MRKTQLHAQRAEYIFMPAIPQRFICLNPRRAEAVILSRYESQKSNLNFYEGFLKNFLLFPRDEIASFQFNRDFPAQFAKNLPDFRRFPRAKRQYPVYISSLFSVCFFATYDITWKKIN